MTPGALETALKLSRYQLNLQLKPLVKAHRVTVTGATTKRLVSLPGQAKEAP